ncbi:MAG: hypothetical protein ACP5T9_04450 [Thermoplasmata archaeon]
MNVKMGIFATLIVALYIVSLTAINTPRNNEKVTDALSPVTPQILDYKIVNQLSTVNLNSNGSYYIYTAVDGGGVSITNYNFNVIGSVTDGNSVISALTGYSHINNGTYDHSNIASYAIAGISIGSTTGINDKLNASYNYSANGNPGASYASLNFSVNNSNSLVVIVAAGSTETSAKLNGNFNINILDSLNSSYLSVIQGYSILNTGNYFVNVTMTPNWQQTTNLDGCGILLSAYIFSPSYFYPPEKYDVNFIESGLPTGTNWSVTLNNVKHSSNTDVISFMVYNGSYPYNIPSVNDMVPNPSMGNVYVNGFAQNVSIKFLPPGKYPVVFQPEGLNQNYIYSVTINNLTESAYGNQNITFSLTNGTYYYKVGSPNGYTATQQSGTVKVSGYGKTLIINFIPKQYRLTIIENGLPPGTSWWVTFNGQNYSSYGSEINISAYNGNYVIYFSSIPGYKPELKSISVKIDNSNTTVKISYSFISPGNISTLYSPDYLLIISILLFMILGVFSFFILRGVKNGL